MTETESFERAALNQLIVNALSEFRLKVYESSGTEKAVAEDANRVTLFRYHSWCTDALWRRPLYLKNGNGPWSGWLKMQYRSGLLAKRRMAMFMVTDDPQHCEGVAGQGWRCGAIRVGKKRDKLPDLSNARYFPPWRRSLLRLGRWLRVQFLRSEDFERDEPRIVEYAKKTFVSEAWVWRRIKIKAHIPSELLAIRVDDPFRKPWGVLVMDSSNHLRCKDTEDATFTAALASLHGSLVQCGVFNE